MNELDILDQVANTSGKNDKRDLLIKYSNHQRLGELLDAAMNFKRKFFIKEVPSYELSDSQEKLVASTHDNFIRLLSQLETGSYRGDTGKRMTTNFLSTLTKQERHWYTRVLKKDLKAGFSLDTAVKCGFDIPIFQVMLAKDGKKMKDKPNFFSKGFWVSPKIDGYRCLAIIDNGECQLLSRNGTEYENFPSIKKSLEEAFPDDSVVLDGEIMSDDFNSMQQSAFASKRGTTVGDVKYFIFDYIPFHEWKSQVFQAKKSSRYKSLNEIFEQNIAPIGVTNLEVVNHTLIKTYDEIIDMEADYILMGYEGAMACPDIPYTLKRSTKSLLKFKTMLSQDCEIIGFYEGEGDSKHEGRLGGVLVTQENGLTCECGSGFSDAERDEVWSNQKDYLGRIIECKYFELTDKGKMRFPVKKRWRDNGADKGKR